MSSKQQRPLLKKVLKFLFQHAVHYLLCQIKEPENTHVNENTHVYRADHRTAAPYPPSP